ncbi:MAG: glycosyltransferase family 4 protein, partial [Nitrosopumilaceae archaeon]
MRICIPVDYGYKADVTSLNVIVKNLFLELGKIMNKRRSFTIAATLLENTRMGDINQRFDCVNVPNIGGFRFPPESVLSSNNLFIGLVGIDEVVLGEKAYRRNTEWKINRPIIEKELKKWKDEVEKIKLIHVSTSSEKEQMIEYLKIPEEKIVVIPLGVDHEKFKPATDKIKIRKKILSKYFLKDRPYFLHVSERNWARKNVFRMFEAFKKARSYGVTHELIVVGKNDPIVNEKAHEVSGIIVLGYVDEKDLIELMQGADVLLMPSLHEGFGLPIVEAMACQVPVITSNVFSQPEVVKDGGLFVDPYNTNDIYEKILEIGNNEKLRTSLADNAFKRSNDFSWT